MHGCRGIVLTVLGSTVWGFFGNLTVITVFTVLTLLFQFLEIFRKF
jgi:hypothetical protein